MNIVSKLITVKRLNHHFYRWDENTLYKHQARRVAAILEHAGRHSPYYSKLRSKGKLLTLDSVPRIDKAEMMANFDQINTAGLKKSELIEFQLEQAFPGKNLANETDKVFALGRLIPQEWMKQAAGAPISSQPMIDAAAEAVAKLNTP